MADQIPTKALSIMQPWAWLIVNGYKSIENRDWPTRFRGPVAIHAGKKIDSDAHRDLCSGIHPVTGERDLEGTSYPGCFCLPPETGGIVGVAEIVDCITASDDDWFVGKHGFVLRAAKPVSFIPVRGALGFFDWRANLLEAQP